MAEKWSFIPGRSLGKHPKHGKDLHPAEASKVAMRNQKAIVFLKTGLGYEVNLFKKSKLMSSVFYTSPSGKKYRTVCFVKSE